eukprot:TRINITY_DN67989_c2_g4_i1.p2 TRINITY_DN67989_c2_g4~~TRINITY_DN67989_c2_g4_i1.p2  ORF type:complete len:137 (+),score=7.91 TRINITY_DN67989_c2_g4_i1:39-413(+)
MGLINFFSKTYTWVEQEVFCKFLLCAAFVWVPMQLLGDSENGTMMSAFAPLFFTEFKNRMLRSAIAENLQRALGDAADLPDGVLAQNAADADKLFDDPEGAKIVSASGDMGAMMAGLEDGDDDM